jgi:hypothetical protein
MHLARCYRVVDMGTQKSSWQGTDKYQRKVMVQFEIHSEDADGKPLLTDKGDPLSISKNYTLSLAERATLAIDLESWRGAAFTSDERKGFDLNNVLGKWAMLNVIKSVGNDGKEYTNIDSINPVPAQVKKAGLPEGHNEAKLFSIDNADMEMYESFSDRLKQKIAESPEWQHKAGRKTEKKSSGSDDFNDDIPF